MFWRVATQPELGRLDRHPIDAPEVLSANAVALPIIPSPRGHVVGQQQCRIHSHGILRGVGHRHDCRSRRARADVDLHLSRTQVQGGVWRHLDDSVVSLEFDLLLFDSGAMPIDVQGGRDSVLAGRQRPLHVLLEVDLDTGNDAGLRTAHFRDLLPVVAAFTVDASDSDQLGTAHALVADAHSHKGRGRLKAFGRPVGQVDTGQLDLIANRTALHVDDHGHQELEEHRGANSRVDVGCQLRLRDERRTVVALDTGRDTNPQIHHLSLKGIQFHHVLLDPEPFEATAKPGDVHADRLAFGADIDPTGTVRIGDHLGIRLDRLPHARRVLRHVQQAKIDLYRGVLVLVLDGERGHWPSVRIGIHVDLHGLNHELPEGRTTNHQEDGQNTDSPGHRTAAGLACSQGLMLREVQIRSHRSLVNCIHHLASLTTNLDCWSSTYGPYPGYCINYAVFYLFGIPNKTLARFLLISP